MFSHRNDWYLKEIRLLRFKHVYTCLNNTCCSINTIFMSTKKIQFLKHVLFQFAFCYYNKTLTETYIEKKRVYLAYRFQPIIKESQEPWKKLGPLRRKLEPHQDWYREAGTEAETMEDHGLLVYYPCLSSAIFFIQNLPVVIQALLYELTIRKIPQGYFYNLTVKAIAQLRYFSQVTQFGSSRQTGMW